MKSVDGMIKTKKELKEYIRDEAKIYRHAGFSDRVVGFLCKDFSYLAGRYVYHLRKTEYYYNNSVIFKKSIKALCNTIVYIWHRRIRNKYACMIDVNIWENSVGKGLKIYHSGVVINRNASVGENCVFMGNNCIGNAGDNKCVPRIGNNVSFGVNAVVIGDVLIGDNCKIGAGAVVNKSFDSNSILVGVPARIK